MSTTVLILTPLALEKNAVIEFLENVTPLRNLKARAFKGSYSFKGKQLEVVVMETGPTIANATDATTEGIIVLKPKIVVLSGIAGAISDDLQLLDVAIGTSAMDYTYAAEKDNETEYRTNVINYDYDLVKIAKDVSENSLWKERVKTSGGERSTAITGMIASGNTVLKSHRGPTYLFLKKSKVLAVEMESHGFATALQGRSIPAINIRAISDLVKDKEASDKHGNQFLAAKIAATFVFCFLEEWYARLENTSTEDDEKKTNKPSKVQASKIKIFIAYAREDEKHKNSIKEKLAKKIDNNLVEIIDDSQITPGAEWDGWLQEKLGECNVMLLLISNAFFQSTYISQTELPAAIVGHETNKKRVIPIILEACKWQKTWLSKLQWVDKNDTELADKIIKGLQLPQQSDNRWYNLGFLLSVIAPVGLTIWHNLEMQEWDTQNLTVILPALLLLFGVLWLIRNKIFK